MKTLRVYTDGSCLGNPGAGGYGVVMHVEPHEGEKCMELSMGFKLTTNNRMELLAAIVALEKVHEMALAYNTNIPCTIITDSQYVKKGITEWIGGWVKNGWKTSTRKPVKNADLWKRLHSITKLTNPGWEWVRGHSGNQYNERCDELANVAARAEVLLIDEGYVQ